MIGYDQFWYTKQLELGLLMPQSQKSTKRPKKAVEVEDDGLQLGAQENQAL